MLTSYLCEELDLETTSRLKQQLTQLGCASTLQDVFWLPVPNRFLTPLQQEHSESCGPYSLPLEILSTSLCLELLVRASGALHCHCIAPASTELRAYALKELDDILQSVMEQ